MVYRLPQIPLQLFCRKNPVSDTVKATLENRLKFIKNAIFWWKMMKKCKKCIFLHFFEKMYEFHHILEAKVLMICTWHMYEKCSPISCAHFEMFGMVTRYLDIILRYIKIYIKSANFCDFFNNSSKWGCS